MLCKIHDSSRTLVYSDKNLHTSNHLDIKERFSLFSIHFPHFIPSVSIAGVKTDSQYQTLEYFLQVCLKNFVSFSSKEGQIPVRVCPKIFLNDLKKKKNTPSIYNHLNKIKSLV